MTYVERPGAYALLRNASGELACVRTGMGLFLPGGGVEAGEASDVALARELLEEIAFEISSARLLGQAAQYHWSDFYQKHFKKVGSFFSVEGTFGNHEAAADHELVWLSRDRAILDLTQTFQRWAVSSWA